MRYLVLMMLLATPALAENIYDRNQNVVGSYQSNGDGRVYYYDRNGNAAGSSYTHPRDGDTVYYDRNGNYKGQSRR